MSALLDLLKDKLGDAVVEATDSVPHGFPVVRVRREAWQKAARVLHDDPALALDLFVELTCIDWQKRDPRFDVLVIAHSLEHGHRAQLVAGVAEDDPAIDSVTSVWKGANWFEREAWDMFGIRFEGHPDPRRILLYEEFVGHPLRKDYDAAKAQPLVPYRPEALDKLPPFGPDEGMPWSRR